MAKILLCKTAYMRWLLIHYSTALQQFCAGIIHKQLKQIK